MQPKLQIPGFWAMDLLFLLRWAACLREPCQALVAVVVARQHPDPWAAWAEGEVVVVVRA